MTAPALDLFPLQTPAPITVGRGNPPQWVRLVREGPVADPVQMPRIRCAEDVAALVGPRLDLEPCEVFLVVLLDSQSRVLAVHEVSRGLLNSSLVHPRETFRAAILAGAAGLVLCHNHPSGDQTPSPEDQAVTRQLVAAGGLLDIPVYDHVIYAGPGRISSLATLGLL